MPSSAANAGRPGHANAAAAAAAMSSDISRRNPQEDYELLQVLKNQGSNNLDIKAHPHIGTQML